ncbi:DUF4350 domain-containing protein [Streptomyces sp. WAC05374]|uniref:DUF4350 domain-containing protein n=1 Tax=Streptomyces sp. WAC05374 TaxID=2487420 RepID=UPI000F85C418|nr:DUF4350 domain-containing protein [Streptomyces sp. WAC05374]RST11424.1 DUF4350 domain-containing protein [Streptomyces sp. WAC05374]TDF44441.1 DUF4350 domain-containing protein [Streptomyces sp. WAC05374]TDF45013.1 DUF4350 domain-containing protein [Streptomyces sp. WAC05374]TDF58462.1 DUF4350 domain-containing protein [Streptomyces sp. WAC05374]
MTTTSTAAPTSTSLTAHQIWRRTRGLLLALAILIVAGIVMALVRSDARHGRLDPRSADPTGSRAVAELLDQRGVTTRVVTTLDEATTATGADTTLLVATPDLLTDHQQSVLHRDMQASGGRTVLVAAGAPSVGTLAPGVTTGSPAPVSALAPRCSLPAATRAGDADLGGERYTTQLPGSDACYPADGRATLLRVNGPAGSDTVLLGSPDILHNERLDKQGNASLALQLLGSRPHLVWYLPSLSDPSAANGGGSGSGDDPEERAGESGFLELIPSGWLWGTLQLALAAVLAAIWRARRLGPLVTEHLPVAIRASESTEGRARLYHRANARDRAAAVLRTATRSRLAPLLGVPATAAHSPETLLPAVSARLAHGDRDLPTLLFGPAPSDDAALTLLADQLDALEREVRTS